MSEIYFCCSLLSYADEAYPPYLSHLLANYLQSDEISTLWIMQESSIWRVYIYFKFKQALNEWRTLIYDCMPWYRVSITIVKPLNKIVYIYIYILACHPKVYNIILCFICIPLHSTYNNFERKLDKLFNSSTRNTLFYLQI